MVKRDYLPVYRDFSSLLENFFRTTADDTSFADTGSWAPAVDIIEDQNQFIVIADIPGVQKDDIQISLERNLLSIQGERYFEKNDNQNAYTRLERAQGKFYRRFTLPQSVDDGKISARYKQGVLEIIIPKQETSVQKSISIKVEE